MYTLIGICQQVLCLLLVACFIDLTTPGCTGTRVYCKRCIVAASEAACNGSALEECTQTDPVCRRLTNQHATSAAVLDYSSGCEDRSNCVAGTTGGGGVPFKVIECQDFDSCANVSCYSCHGDADDCAITQNAPTTQCDISEGFSCMQAVDVSIDGSCRYTVSRNCTKSCVPSCETESGNIKCTTCCNQDRCNNIGLSGIRNVTSYCSSYNQLRGSHKVLFVTLIIVMIHFCCLYGVN